MLWLIPLVIVLLTGCTGNVHLNENLQPIVANTTPASIGTEESTEKVILYFFWGEGCPHCIHEKQFLEQLGQHYPELEVRLFETWYNQDNAKLFVEMAEAYGTRASGVPTTFLEDNVWVGYADYMGEEIEDKVKYCIEHGCFDPIEKLEKPSEAEEMSEDLETVSPLEAVCVHVFLHGECPQCENVTPYLDYLTEEYNVELTRHDVSFLEEKDLYEKFKETYGFEYGAYPIVFIGNRFLIGETAIKGTLEQEIISCSEKGCICPAEKIGGLTPYPPQPKDITPEEDNLITLPVFGEIDTSKMSLSVFTIILGFLDGFNPCAFFVLFFLLSMLIYAKSRKRMLLIGGTFVFFSGFIYLLFMSAWLNLFLLIGQLRIITTVAGIIALIVAAINIKDFFFFGKGVSLVIPEKAKPKLFVRMRNLLKATSIPSMMIGTIVLAIAANTYELLCTAGFPMVFTRVLTLHSLSTLQYYLYLVLYNATYVIPLAFIVLIFTMTLGAKKLTEWEGQILKLLSGVMMLCLGLVLVINPALLNNIFVAVGLLATALVIAGIIIFITKKLKKRNGEKLRSQKPVLLLILLCSLLGLAVSVYDASHSWGTEDSFCDISAVFSCTVVNTSDYARILGIPVAHLGIAGYSILFTAGALLFFLGPTVSIERFLVFASGAAVVFSLYLTAIEAFVLRVFCPTCLASQTVILLIFIWSVSLTTKEERDEVRRILKQLITHR